MVAGNRAVIHLPRHSATVSHGVERKAHAHAQLGLKEFGGLSREGLGLPTYNPSNTDCGL